MAEEWFKWEREGALHPMFFPMEAAFAPFEKYAGKQWPDTIMIFKGDIVLWCNRMQDLYALGQELIDELRDEKNREKMLADLERETEKMKSVIEKIKKTKINDLDDSSLLGLYKELNTQFLDWFAIGWLVEPVYLQGEQLVLKKTTDKKMVSILTSTTRDSFSKREARELLQIAELAKKGENIDAQLDAHAEKYFWMQNGYFKTETLDSEFFRKEMDALLKEHPAPLEYVAELDALPEKIRAERGQAMKDLNFAENDRALIELIDLFAWFQDYRKEYTMQAMHCLDLLLSEIGKRGGLSLKEMKYTLPHELESVLGKKFPRAEIEMRMKNCIVIWNKDAEKYEFYAGKDALEREQGLFPVDDASTETVEIHGMIASQGKIEGRVKVTMSPDDAMNIKQGEILVTSMTSPDFIVAIKRAAAIVTNEGGITCHAAIISREFGIPCIVGTKIATKALKTGDYVEVNANHGFVRKVARRE